MEQVQSQCATLYGSAIQSAATYTRQGVTDRQGVVWGTVLLEVIKTSQCMPEACNKTV